MTLPNERSRAVKQTRDFLRSLLNPKLTPKVPKKIREQAYWCLKHFPSDSDINCSAKVLSTVWEKLDKYE